MIELIILKYDGFKGIYGQTLSDLYTALCELDTKGYFVVPEDVKNIIIEKIWFLKVEAARLLVEHFKVNEYEFEEGDEVFNTLKDAVITHGGYTNVGD